MSEEPISDARLEQLTVLDDEAIKAWGESMDQYSLLYFMDRLSAFRELARRRLADSSRAIP